MDGVDLTASVGYEAKVALLREGADGGVAGVPPLGEVVARTALWPAEADACLVSWLDTHSTAAAELEADLAAAAGPRRDMFASARTVQPADVRLAAEDYEYGAAPLRAVPLAMQLVRVMLLRGFNERLAPLLRLLAGSGGDEGGAGASSGGAGGISAGDEGEVDAAAFDLTAILPSLSHLLFAELKYGMLRTSLAEGRGGGGGGSVTLDNLKAMVSAETAATTHAAASQCIFAQFYRQLTLLGAARLQALFRTNVDDRGRIISVRYEGESGIDAGGVSRDAFMSVVDDCFSPRFNLLVPVPLPLALGGGGGGVGGGGGGDDVRKYMPNPVYAGDGRAAGMYDFLGKMMGVSMRSRMMLPFELPQGVWKMITGLPLVWEDVVSVDPDLGALLVEVATAAALAGAAGGAKGAAAGGSGATRFSTDWVFTADGTAKGAALVPGGERVAVTAANADAFLAAAVQYCLGRLAPQAAAIRGGLFSIVPAGVVRLLSWQQVEVAVAGRGVLDVGVMRDNTEYEGYRATDATIKHFWEALAGFSQPQRAAFMRFAWGSPRMPGRWTRRLKITRLSRPENYRPVSHTCFMSIELPPYSSLATLRDRLLDAIYNSLGIANA